MGGIMWGKRWRFMLCTCRRPASFPFDLCWISFSPSALSLSRSSSSSSTLPFHPISSSSRLFLRLLPGFKPLAPRFLTPSFKGNYEIASMRRGEFLNSTLRPCAPQWSCDRLCVVIPALYTARFTAKAKNGNSDKQVWTVHGSSSGT